MKNPIPEKFNHDDLKVSSDSSLTTSQAAVFIGTTEAMLRRSRSTGELYRGIPGPKYQKRGPRLVRYNMGDLILWLSEVNQSYQSTAEYTAVHQKACSSARSNLQIARSKRGER